MTRTLTACAFIALACAALPCAAQQTAPAAATAPATSTAPASQPATISWDAAKSHINQTVTVTGPVISTHTTADGSHVTLNLGKDFPDAARFTVYLSSDKNDPDATYKGKTIAVTGQIILFRDIPEIKAEPKDITIQKESK